MGNDILLWGAMFLIIFGDLYLIKNVGFMEAFYIPLVGVLIVYGLMVYDKEKREEEKRRHLKEIEEYNDKLRIIKQKQPIVHETFLSPKNRAIAMRKIRTIEMERLKGNSGDEWFRG